MREILLFSVFTFTLVSCGPTVKINKSSGTDFGAVKSFAFMEYDIENKTDIEPYKPNIDLTLMAVRKELKSKGLSESDDADVHINIGVVIEPEIVTRETQLYEAPRYMGQRNYSWSSEEVVAGKYEKGTLYVDMVTAEDSKIIWEGIASARIQKNKEKMGLIIQKAVAKMFKNYP